MYNGKECNGVIFKSFYVINSCINMKTLLFLMWNKWKMWTNHFSKNPNSFKGKNKVRLFLKF